MIISVVITVGASRGLLSSVHSPLTAISIRQEVLLEEKDETL